MKFCFVGVGSIATKHIKALKQVDSKIEIHAFRTGKSHQIGEVQSLISKEFFNFDLLDEKYDAVFICNPTNMHYDTLCKFYTKADIFFIEKPVFDKKYNLDCFKNLDTKKFYVACPLRYTGVLERAKKIVVEKGCPVSARIICSSFLPDWRPNVDYRTVYSAHKEMGGGVDIDLIHEIDYMTYLFDFPKQVYSIKGKYSNLEINSSDLAVHIFEYDDFVVEMHLDYFGKKNQRYLELYYNDEYIKCDLINNCIEHVGKTNYTESILPCDRSVNEMKNFLALVGGKKHVENNLLTAIKNLNLAKGE